MSPGGFDSVATGFGGAADVEPGALGDWDAPADEVLAGDVGAADGVEAEPVQPARPARATAASGTAVSCLIFMELSLPIADISTHDARDGEVSDRPDRG
jgi:hypothetical protein